MLFENICGLAIKPLGNHLSPRMKEVWMMADVMSEEDIVETLTAMMCIPGDKRDASFGMIVPSDSSMWGMCVVEACHFDICNEQDKDGKCVIIRNLPCEYVVN